jgi:hypothetical protein
MITNLNSGSKTLPLESEENLPHTVEYQLTGQFLVLMITA